MRLLRNAHSTHACMSLAKSAAALCVMHTPGMRLLVVAYVVLGDDELLPLNLGLLV